MSIVGSFSIWALSPASPQLDAVPAPPLKWESAGAQAMSPTAAMTGSPVEGSVACAVPARPPRRATATAAARNHARRFMSMTPGRTCHRLGRVAHNTWTVLAASERV